MNAFCVAEEEISIWRQAIQKPIDGPRFGLSVEIDQNVTAQDEIEGSRSGISIIAEIDAMEPYNRANCLAGFHLTLLQPRPP